MDLDKKYALLESIPGRGASSFRGRQLASGREVTVHLLGGKPEERKALLSRIRALPSESLSQVVEAGEQEGTVYLVTSAPPHCHFSEWLPEARSSNTSGFFEAAIPSEDTSGGVQPGEFTRFFNPGSIGPETNSPAGATAPGAGEFTQPFVPPAAPRQTGTTTGGFLDTAQFNPPNAAAIPGEYTRIIGHSLRAAAPEPDQTPVAQPTQPEPQTAADSPDRRTITLARALVFCLLSFAAGVTLVLLFLPR
jgi:hypothetical protein